MHVVLVTHFYPAHGGGIEKVAAQLAMRMAEMGCDLKWFASDCDAPPVQPGVRCEPMSSFNGVERWSGFPYPLWSPKALLRLARAVRQADAVHVHDAIYASSVAAALFACWYGKRLVVTQHIGTVPLPALLSPLLWVGNHLTGRLVMRRARAVAFISPAVRQYFESIIGGDERFFDVPNGVDGSIFHPVEATPASLRAELGLDARRPLMLFVGRFAPKKRLPIVRAMAAMRPDWQWAVIGHGPEQPERWDLPNVIVRGPLTQTELARWYRAADLLVLPSHGEGFPLVVQEGMACALPACITAEVAAGSTMPADLWLQLPESAGSGDPVAETAAQGVRAIETWLALPAAQRQQQRAACAQLARDAWDWEAATRRHLQWLRPIRL